MKYNYHKHVGFVGAFIRLCGFTVFVVGVAHHDWFYLIGGALLAVDWTKFTVVHYHDGDDDET